MKMVYLFISYLPICDKIERMKIRGKKCEVSMKDLIIVRGGGDIATGTIYKLKKCGFSV